MRHSASGSLTQAADCEFSPSTRLTCIRYLAPQLHPVRDHADIARSSGDGHQDHHCCGERDYLAPVALHSRPWAANFAAYSLPQVAETRVLMLELVGSDSHSPLTLWEVVSGLAPWLSINGFHVCRSNQNPSLIYSLSICNRANVPLSLTTLMPGGRKQLYRITTSGGRAARPDQALDCVNERDHFARRLCGAAGAVRCYPLATPPLPPSPTSDCACKTAPSNSCPSCTSCTFCTSCTAYNSCTSAGTPTSSLSVYTHTAARRSPSAPR